MTYTNVTHPNITYGKAPTNIFLLVLQRPIASCYGSTHNQRLALPAVTKRILKNGFLSVLRKNKNRFRKRFPRTPSKEGLTLIFKRIFLFFRTLPRLGWFFKFSQYTETMSEVTKGRPKSSKRLSSERKASTVAESQIQEVFDYWVSACKPNAKRKPILDEKRRLAIGAAIHDYDVEQCKNAITGCTVSDFHMGRNKANRKYDDVELILRDSKHIEQFLELFDKSTGVDW